MEENVTVVEKIDIMRQPLPNLEAIYFITPTVESIDLFINDFKKKDKPMYAAAHLFFTSRLPDELFQKMQGSIAATKIKSLKELNIEFLPYESQAFHFDMPESLVALFSPEAPDPHAMQHRIANRVVSLLATLSEYPIVRYSTSHPISRAIAGLVQEKIDHLARHARGWTPNLEDRAQLIILDRTQDPIAPLLHEFTYQAMVYDLLEVLGDRYVYSFLNNSGLSQKKEVILGESDMLWPVLRHMHIADTINWVIESFNDFMKNNKASKLGSGKQVESLKDMSEAMRAMPQYQEMLSKYSLHIHLANTAMDIFQARGLERIGSVEQDMATGEDADGKTIKNVISSLAPILSDPDVSKADKMRLIMLYIISQEGIKDSDRKRLVDMAKITNAEQTAISNLFYLGVTLAKGAKGKSKSKEAKKRKKKRGGDVPFELSRYTPSVKDIGTDLIEGTLPVATFPFLREDHAAAAAESKPSGGIDEKLSLKGARSKQPRWSEKGKKKEEAPKERYVGGRVIIFIVGGMTMSEMRAAYELTQASKRQVFIGSTHVLRPVDFLEDLTKIKKLDTAI
eukprot:TRINITY_DN2667_c0_g1_i1.p1 TRINITY_DN2667_c0_g1~~TRINITY_DN2667_c0_g1_i1.p1  ORF type:complete len:620 (-),score=203.59 TRINITY_DN2667_c0_g1_i1:32-1732(-)